MPRGGLRNPKGGRPIGSKNKLPSGKNYDQFKQMVYDAQMSEYLYTNDARVFEGNALQLMRAIYKAENLPVKIRLYAATKAVEFEPKSAKEIDDAIHSASDEDLDWLINQLDRLDDARQHEAAREAQDAVRAIALPPPAQPMVGETEALPTPIDGNRYGYRKNQRSCG